jgi:hypothetical protein
MAESITEATSLFGRGDCSLDLMDWVGLLAVIYRSPFVA